MKDFIAIDIETANPQRVSACALGYARVIDSRIVESQVFLIKPIGGHAEFQSKIHGIKKEDTYDKPHFGVLFKTFKEIFSAHLVAHSQFDRQVLNALSTHFNLDLRFDYTDSCAIAKELLPHLKDFKLKTLAKHFNLPKYKHHDAKEDAIACAQVYLNLFREVTPVIKSTTGDEKLELYGLLKGILADDEINYKEAYELLYWLEDHPKIKKIEPELYSRLKECLEDQELSEIEADELKMKISGIWEAREAT